MLISIINNTLLQKDEVQQVIRSINRQLSEDFKRYWHRDVELRLEGWTGEEPDPETPLDMRGDAVIYLSRPRHRSTTRPGTGSSANMSAAATTASTGLPTRP